MEPGYTVFNLAGRSKTSSRVATETTGKDRRLRVADLARGYSSTATGNSAAASGVTIGADTVVGAGSVVTRDLPPRVLAVGSPARVIREL